MSFAWNMERKHKTTHLQRTRNMGRIKDQNEKEYPFLLVDIEWYRIVCASGYSPILTFKGKKIGRIYIEA